MNPLIAVQNCTTGRFRGVLVLLLILVSSPANAADARAQAKAYMLHFPKFARAETATSSGRVTELRLTVDCGIITGVSNIPRGWSLELQGPSSGRTVFTATAEHGATYLWDLKPWNGSISIVPTDVACLDVNAEIVTDGPTVYPKPLIRYGRKQLNKWGQTPFSALTCLDSTPWPRLPTISVSSTPP